VAGCKEVSDIEAGKANELFDLIDKFAGYGFNKSHAAAYALLAYHTAWFKAHYPTNSSQPPCASICISLKS
jgi:DNA polymerase-3 subunit alpha